MDLAFASWMFGLNAVAAVLALLVVTRLQARWLRPRVSQLTEDPGLAIFLFDSEDLLDASAGARLILAGVRAEGSDLGRFLDWAEPRFAGLREGLKGLRGMGALRAAGDGLSLLAEWRSGLIRITIHEPHLDSPFRSLDHLSERSREEELADLRQLLEGLPLPVWTLDAAGHVTWANRAYLALLERRHGAGGPLGWPLPELFSPSLPSGRVALALPSEELWFDCEILRQAGATTVYALPVQGQVQAERALSVFSQTLTRTFADLPIGLAMFDRQRRLHLFNPALTDLTTLPVAFLAGRPTLGSFLDSMRDRGMIPEPSDYQAWRNRIAALDTAERPADLEEIWALQSGLTYRVVVRPNAGGTLVLLVQDISDEIAGTRRMKQNLELGQSVIDHGIEALAVFAASGQLVMTNPAYARLWQDDPMQSLRPVALDRLLSGWSLAASPSTFWTRVEAFVGRSLPHPPETAQIRLNDGRQLQARVLSLSGGATMVGFQLEEPARPLQEADGRDAAAARAG